MSDTTIRSHFGKKLKIGYRGDGEVQIECGPDHDNTGNHVRIYKLDELKAALGIDELGCGCDEADDNLKAALKRAEDAEAFGAAAVARAEKAEATIERVRAWVDSEDQFDALDAILNPEDTEALDSEAQRLYSASDVASVGYKGYYELNEEGKDVWRSVARKAREVYGAEA